MLTPLDPVNDALGIHLPNLTLVRAAYGNALSILKSRCEDVGLLGRSILNFIDDGIDIAPNMHGKS
ncbi:hypothetical protein D3C71_2063850 [compost metagenome]